MGVSLGAAIAALGFVHQAVPDALRWPIALVGLGLIGTGLILPVLRGRNRSTDLPISAGTAKALGDLGGYRPRAVDDGILLHEFPRSLQDDLVTLSFAGPRPDALVLENPAIEELRAAIIAAGLEPSVNEYLFSRIAENRQGRYLPKVGVRAIVYERPEIDLPLTLRVAPLSFWVEAQFNRRILTAIDGDSRLRALFEQCRSDTLRSWKQDRDDVTLSGPASLFAEVAIATSEQELMIVHKRARSGSDIRKAGRGWSCTLEEGVRWDHTSATHLDLKTTLLYGLRSELSIEPDQLAQTHWFGIALEHHLNVGFLGLTCVNLTAADLRGRIPNHDFDDCDFVGFSRLDRIFGREQDKKWHPTARLRAFQSFSHLVGERETREAIHRIRHGRSATR